jgi:4-amino-4-deoxy-L-arabinose transferase-like glycosyltransferase
MLAEASKIRAGSILVCLAGDFSPSFSSTRTKLLLAENSTSRWDALPAFFLYILLSTAFIPLAGVQNDESLFAVPLYQAMTRDLRLFHHNIQLMVMSYVGTVKTFLWAPVLHLFGASVWSVRAPAVFLSALTILFFHRLLRIAGASRIAAGVCALMMATDPVFLLTNTFDWGPVAVEHFFAVTGCLCLLLWSKKLADSLLCLGFFLFGLALWNKAIFLWALGGLVVASVSVFRHEIRILATRRRIVLAAAAFVAGASPFLFYNLNNQNRTLRENAHLDSPATAFSKWVALKNTANGNGLFGYMVEEEWEEHPKNVSTGLGRLSLWLRYHLGARRESGLYWIYLGLLVAVPLWWRSRMAWFGVLFCAATWAAMAFTHEAGGSLHHTILLWPFPLLLVAAVLSRIPWRVAVGMAGLVLVGMNLLVVNQYLAQFERFGAARDFTDALFPLADALPSGSHVYVVDWGMYNTMLLFHKKGVVLHTANEPFMDDRMSEEQVRQAQSMLEDPEAVFLGHVQEKEVFEGVNVRLEKYAESRGLHKQMVQTIADSNGRPLFQLFRFVT